MHISFLFFFLQFDILFFNLFMSNRLIIFDEIMFFLLKHTFPCNLYMLKSFDRIEMVNWMKLQKGECGIYVWE